MNEFDIIEKYFTPLSKDGLKDDTAIISIPSGHELVVSSDTLNAGTHFMPDAAPADIAHKALRSNLSDLAASGADPLSYQLNIAFPQKPSEKWLEAFTGALAADQKHFGIFCSGGDTTSIKGPLSISITALGLVPTRSAVRRDGAKPGDVIILTGPVGDALAGLKILRGEIRTENDDYFIRKYYRPTPRLDLTVSMRAYAHAAIDISDGLIADLGHICKSSAMAAVVELDKIAFSSPAQKLLETGAVIPADFLTGGDDYELLLAVSSSHAAHFPNTQIIGHFVAGVPGVRLLDISGKPIPLSHKGWSHF